MTLRGDALPVDGLWIDRGRLAVVMGLAAVIAYAIFLAMPVITARLGFDAVMEHTEAVTHYLVATRRDVPFYVAVAPEAILRDTSTIYHPLYYWYLRVLPFDWVNSFAGLRTLSFVPPILAAACLIEAGSRMRFELRYVGAVWLMLMAALFPLNGWMDLARPEAMFMTGLALVYFCLCVPDDRRWKFATTGFAIAATFAVKQPGVLLLAVPAALSFLDRRYAMALIVGAASCIVVVGILYLTYGDAYLDWAFRRPGGDPYFPMQSLRGLWAYAQHIAVALVAPVLLVAMLWFLDRRAAIAALPVVALCAAIFPIALIPAGKLGGWIGNWVIFTWAAGIPMAIIILMAIRRPSFPAAAVAALVMIGLLQPILRQERDNHRLIATPGPGDIAVRQLLQRISADFRGDVWTTTWPMIDQRAGREPRVPAQQFCTVAPQCTEFAPSIPLRGEPSSAWAYVSRGQIDVVLLPSNVVIDPLTALVARRYVRCASLLGRFNLRHMFGQPYLPSEIWTSTASGCETLRRQFSL